MSLSLSCGLSLALLCIILGDNMKYQDLKKENKKLWNLIRLQNKYIHDMAGELDTIYYLDEIEEREWTW